MMIMPYPWDFIPCMEEWLEDINIHGRMEEEGAAVVPMQEALLVALTMVYWELVTARWRTMRPRRMASWTNWKVDRRRARW